MFHSKTERRGLHKSKPFLMKKSVTAWAGSSVMNTRKTAGSLLIEILTNQQRTRLFMLKEIGREG